MGRPNGVPKTIGEFFAAHPEKLTAFVEDFSAVNASMRRFVEQETSRLTPPAFDATATGCRSAR